MLEPFPHAQPLHMCICRCVPMVACVHIYKHMCICRCVHMVACVALAQTKKATGTPLWSVMAASICRAMAHAQLLCRARGMGGQAQCAWTLTTQCASCVCQPGGGINYSDMPLTMYRLAQVQRPLGHPSTADSFRKRSACEASPP